MLLAAGSLGVPGWPATPATGPVASSDPHPPACFAVDGDWILGRHLAAVQPVFGFLDPAFRLGYVPLPGGRRILTVAGQLALARRNHHEFSLADSDSLSALCFEYATRALDSKQIEQAIQRFTGALSVEVLDFSRYRVPDGEIEFLSSAPAPAAPGSGNASRQSRIFRGRVRYGARRSQSIWARATCRFEHRRVLARVALEPGRPIAPHQLELATIVSMDSTLPGATDPRPLAGLTPRRPIPPGAPVDPKLLTRPAEIERGDKVEVEVKRGRAKISIESAAESKGRRGDAILLRNLETGRRFRALVAGKGKAVVP
ncbi:MAG: flagellar basal body P-ring formation chaperone FlgA [Bryobacteraceae bacterium]